MQFDGYYEKLFAQYKVRTVQTNFFFFFGINYTQNPTYTFLASVSVIPIAVLTIYYEGEPQTNMGGLSASKPCHPSHDAKKIDRIF